MEVPGVAESLQGVAIKREEPEEGMAEIKKEVLDEPESGVNAKYPGSEQGVKRKNVVDSVSISDDDDEEFAGFEDNGGSAVGMRMASGSRSKRFRNSAPNNALSPTMVIKQELPDDDEMAQMSTPNVKKVTPQRPGVVKLDDPIFRKPFEYGWKRELVYRAVAGISKEKGEVYYFTPTSKKLRTRTEIQQNLTHDLTLDNFTFVKEPLGLGPEFEIIRNAKSNAATMKRASMASVDTPSRESPLGKRIPKPKGPKGGSPPPASIRILNRSRSSVSSPRSKDKEDIKVQTAKSPSKVATGAPAAASKAKGEPCTIQCVLAMGTIPQLQCRKCLCLYHHECVGVERGATVDARYICQGCLEEEQAEKQPIQVSPLKTPATKGSKTPSTSKTRTQAKSASTDEAPPQTIATIAGRKYIVVPRTNVLGAPGGPAEAAATTNGAASGNGTEQEDAKKRKNDVAVVQQNSDILRDTAGIAGKVPNDTVKSTIAIGGGGGKVKKGGKGTANVV
uniref:Uncharacterized protein n=1 Tax=Phlebotomus papatasi TaxID=29031 RepID=A0A1B0DE12_PHLPP